MAQMLYDMEVAKVIKSVDNNYNILDALKKEARSINSAEARKLFDQYAKEQGKGQTGEELYNQFFQIEPTESKVELSAKTLKMAREKRDFIKKALGDRFVTWENLAKNLDGYEVWYPSQGNMFFMADSIPAKLAEDVVAGVLESVEISAKEIRKVLAMGGKKRAFIVPTEVANTLDNLMPDTSNNPFLKGHKKVVRAWKIWQLISPRRYAKYNIRNLTGDADAMFAGNPRAFKKTPEAIRDLSKVFIKKEKGSQNLQEWFELGGYQSTLQAQEMGELNELTGFGRFLDRQKKKSFKDIPARAWKSYWKMARVSTDFREAILRYSAYLDYMDQLNANNGKPKNFGASIPEEIMALPDNKTKAYWLANDLLGAYDKVGVMGQALREHMIPFWSWKEVNFKRYIRLFRNAANEGRFAQVVGRKVIGKAVSPFTAYRVGKFMIKATAFWSMLQMWNHLKFPDEEEELPESVTSRPHIILGRDKNGNIITFNRIGALGDFLEWFGLDTAPQTIDNWMKGKQTLKEIAVDMLKSPINVVASGTEPFTKTGFELATRRSLYPDAFNPRTIRDRMLYMARNFGVENEYLVLSGKPSKPYIESLKTALVYAYDPYEVAYHTIYDEKIKFLKKKGKIGEGFWLTPRGDALYNMKLAGRYGDKVAAKKYYDEYMAFPGATEKGIEQSLENLNPLSGLSKNELAEFALFLPTELKVDVAMALIFYQELTGNKGDREKMKNERLKIMEKHEPARLKMQEYVRKLQEKSLERKKAVNQ